ncbi:MAG: hypothetical protein ACRDT4_01015 [Micromonosporaceae bacterium]
MSPATPKPARAQYRTGPPRILISELDVRDPEVLAEAHHWADGHRGAAADEEALAQADLTGFVHTALRTGAQAIQIAAGTSQATDLRQVIADVGEQAERVTAQATRQSELAAKRAETAMATVADQTRHLVGETAGQVRASVQEALAGTVTELQQHLARLCVGENAELPIATRAAVEKAGVELQTALDRGIREGIEALARKFDVHDAASPIFRLASTMAEQQDRATREIVSGQRDLATRLDQLNTTVASATAAAQATARATEATTLKGAPYEGAIHEIVDALAGTLGDDYENTANTVGRLRNSRKGDGVLTILGVRGAPGESARVVIETTAANSRRNWNDYLESAQANRDAHAALGIVPRVDLVPGGAPIRLFGSQRIVLAFDPAVDDPALLRSAILMLRAQACLIATRHHGDHVAHAAEKIAEAQDAMDKMRDLYKIASNTRAGADKLLTGLADLQSTLHARLAEAADLLLEANACGSPDPSTGAAA